MSAGSGAAGEVGEVREVRDDDDLDALHEGWRPWFGEEMTRKMFAASPADVPKAMLAVEVDGALAGYAMAIGAGITDGHRGLATVYVAPAHRGRGIGTTLTTRVLEICNADRVPGVRVSADVDDSTSIAIAEAHGFVAHGRHLESELDLTDVERLRDLPGAPDGVILEALPDDASDDDWHAFHDTFERLMRDTPDAASGSEPMPYEVFRAAVADAWQVQGAWVDGEMVGFTCVMVRDPRGRRVNTMLTAVNREHRGRGLATALKVRQALALSEAGWRGVVTQNMEGNDAILAANRRMGFRPAGGYVDLVYDFAR